MTESPSAVVGRLSWELAAISAQLARVSAELDAVGQPVRQAPSPAYWPQYPPSYAHPRPATASPPPSRPASLKRERDEGWIGKLLAVAGVAVTLIGVVLLLVLAAQAGILAPEFRVTGGALLAAVMTGIGLWLYARPGGRVGAIALAATGIATAYIDVIAVTTIYGWVSAPIGLVIAAVIGGVGLTLARRWDSEPLGLLVLVPLIFLAPVVAGGVTLLLVAFMLALAAASLPVQLGKDWMWLHSARTAATTMPLVIALLGVSFDDGRDPYLAAACGIAALLAVVAALVLLPHTGHPAAMALLTGTGGLPVLCVGLAVDHIVAALMAGVLSAALLALVLVGRGLAAVVRVVWTAISALAALTAVLVAFDGDVAGPLLLGMAIIVAIAGPRVAVATWVSLAFALVGAGLYLAYAPPESLAHATAVSTSDAVSTLVSSALLMILAGAVVVSWKLDDSVAFTAAAMAVLYAVTTLAVTAGVMIGGEEGGFLAGHMAATILWICLAASLLGYAARLPRADRSLPIAGGLALVAAAMSKLFLFDLGTLDGMFRVAVFIVVGLVLLGMGAGYARLLDKQDRVDVTAVTD